MMFDNIRQHNPELRREIFRKKIEQVNGIDNKIEKSSHLKKNSGETDESNGNFFDFKNVLKNFDFPNYEKSKKNTRKYNISDYCSYINKLSTNIPKKNIHGDNNINEKIVDEKLNKEDFNQNYSVIKDKNSKSTDNIQNNLNLNNINQKEKKIEESNLKNKNFFLNDNFIENKENQIDTKVKECSSKNKNSIKDEQVLKEKKLYSNKIQQKEDAMTINENVINIITKNTENKSNITNSKKPNNKTKDQKKKMNAFCSFFSLCFS
jgi:hypothetical protein